MPPIHNHAHIEALKKHLDILESQINNTPDDADVKYLKRDLRMIIKDIKHQVIQIRGEK